jgi:hypothetical protein
VVVAEAVRPARIGALVLAILAIAPSSIALASHFVIETEGSELDEQLGFFWIMLVTKALTASLGALAVFLFTTWRPAANPDASLTLRVLGVVRAAAAWGSLGALYVEGLHIWQVSAALSLPDLVFGVALVRYLAALFDDDKSPKVARSTRQYAWLYGAYRAALFFVWAVPVEYAATFNLAHRAVAPIMDGVVAILLLRAASTLARR